MSQTEKLETLLKDGNWHRVDNIIRDVYEMDKVCVARISARILDLKKKGYEIESRPSVFDKKLWEYRIKAVRVNEFGDSVLPSCCVPLNFKSFGNYKSAQCPRCKKVYYEKAA